MIAYHRQCLGKGTWLQLPTFLLFCDIQLKYVVDIVEQNNFQMGFLLWAGRYTLMSPQKLRNSVNRSSSSLATFPVHVAWQSLDC